MDKSHDISVLNGLIETTLDSYKAVIEEVERGEDYLKAKYESALQDDELSPDTRQAIQQAYQSVRAGHDRVSAIKHQMEG